MSHVAEIRVRYHDTDKMGVANHISYFRWFEVGRAELLRSINLSMMQLEKFGYFLVLKEVRCVYESPAWYDDLLEVKTKIVDVRQKAMRFEYVISKGDADFAKGYSVHVFTDGAGKAKEIPQKFRKKLVDALE